ncbi:unnamed protein product [Nezara viridula]|uniref:Uncharacterized protein n=1 Tax=Nezara viridula TaxID=85310 RepID=A0A9P0H9A3_NEZVI|nr:unnamed protein product [Nezara viridula]
MLKWRLKNEHRRELRYFHEIIELTRNIANSFENDDRYRQIAHNLHHEKQLRRIIDHHIRRINRSDNSADISTTMLEVRERKHFFDEQYNFINVAISYGEMDFVYPQQLLNMSFERQRLIFKNIHRYNYSAHQLPSNDQLTSGEAVPRAMEEETYFDFEETSVDSSDSDSDKLPVLVPIQETESANNETTPLLLSMEEMPQEADEEIQKTESDEEIQKTESDEQIQKTESDEEIPKIESEITIITVSSASPTHQSTLQEVLKEVEEYLEKEAGVPAELPDIAKLSGDPVDPSGQPSQEQQSQQDDGEDSKEKTENGVQCPVFDPSLLAPGCSKWTRPRPI